MSCFSFSYLLSVPHCGPAPQSSLHFHYVDTLEDYRPITLFVSPDLHLFHVSPLSDWSCTFCQDYHRDGDVFVPLGDRVWFFHFDHLNEMRSTMLLHCKVILFPFVTNNYCGKVLWNYVYIPFVIKLSVYSFINLYLEYVCFPFYLMNYYPLPSLLLW